MSSDKIKILLIDDHQLVRSGIRHMLADVEEYEICAEGESGEEAINLARDYKPDLILMDLRMPGIGGLEATRRILQNAPKTRILILTACKDPLYPARLLQAGARGYVTKEANAEEMLKAIRHILNEQHYISPEIAHKLATKNFSKESDSPFEELSERELQVAIMVADGFSVNDIGAKLFLSVKTINSYRYRIFEKLKVDNDVELTLLAVRYGLIDVDDHNSKMDEDDT